jgi:hypothetical protein
LGEGPKAIPAAGTGSSQKKGADRKTSLNLKWMLPHFGHPGCFHLQLTDPWNPACSLLHHPQSPRGRHSGSFVSWHIKSGESSPSPSMGNPRICCVPLRSPSQRSQVTWPGRISRNASDRNCIWRGFLGRYSPPTHPATPTHPVTGAGELRWKALAFSTAGLRSRLPSTANPRPSLPPPPAGHWTGGRGQGPGPVGGRGPPGWGRGFVAGAEAGCSPVGTVRCSSLQESLSLRVWLGRGLGFFLFLEVPFTLVCPRVPPRGSRGMAAGLQGAPHPTHALWGARRRGPGGIPVPRRKRGECPSSSCTAPCLGLGQEAGQVGVQALGRGVRGGCLPGWVGGGPRGEVAVGARARLFPGPSLSGLLPP